MTQIDLYTAFQGDRRIASGELRQVIEQTAALGEPAQVRIFDNATGRLMDADPRQLSAAPPIEAEARRGPGRPKLGVVAREVTLLPRHWDWLAAQPGGASVALRKLVEAARKSDDGPAHARRAQDAAYRFMHALAGDRPGYEEALRALYAADADRFATFTETWPVDIRDHARALAQPAFAVDAGFLADR